MTVVTVFSIAAPVVKIPSLSSQPSRMGKDGIKDMKNVQISQDLFFAIMKYFLFEEEELLPEIQKGLEQKLDALVMRELYTKYKTAPTEEEKQEARKKYLDKRGVPDSFRW